MELLKEARGKIAIAAGLLEESGLTGSAADLFIQHDQYPGVIQHLDKVISRVMREMNR